MRNFIALIFSCLLFCSCGSPEREGTSLKRHKEQCLADYAMLRTFCTEASQDHKLFAAFRRNPLYHYSLENVPFEKGEEALAALVRKSPGMLAKADFFQEVDRIGGPEQFNYGSLGMLSPAAVCDIVFVAEVIERAYGRENLRILEINGGYGQRCAILSHLLSVQSYTIVDLPEVAQLARVCVDKLGVKNVRFVSDVEEMDDGAPYDLVISAGGFSEWNREIQKKWIERVIARSSMGLLYLASEMGHYHVKRFDKSQLAHKLEEALGACEKRETDSTRLLVTWDKRRLQNRLSKQLQQGKL